MNHQSTNTQNLSFDVYWLGFIRTCMRPLIKILVKQKVEFNSFQNLVKELFVEEAETHINSITENSRGKISSIAYQTGLDRREVSKILKNTASNVDQNLTEQARSRESNILEHWISIPPFCNEAHEPIPLKRSGTGLSFETLVQRFGKNISHGPILDALLEANCIKIIDNKVHMTSKSYVPKLNISTQKINIAAQSIKRLVDTISHNFETDETTMFQRNLYSIRIPKSRLSQFKDEVSKMIINLYENQLTKSFDLIESKHESSRHEKNEPAVGLGVFYFEDNEIKSSN